MTEVSSPIVRILRYVSLGKLNVGLYFNRSQSYSTIVGGLCSMVLALALIVFSVVSFAHVVNQTHYTIEANIIPKTSPSDYNSIYDQTIPNFQFIESIIMVLNSTNTSLCRSATITIMYFEGVPVPTQLGQFYMNDTISSTPNLKAVYCHFTPSKNLYYQAAVSANFTELKAFTNWDDGRTFFNLAFELRHKTLTPKGVHVNYKKSQIVNNGLIQYSEVIELDGSYEQNIVDIDLLEYQNSENLITPPAQYESQLLVSSFKKRYNDNNDIKYIAVLFSFGTTINQFIRQPRNMVGLIIQIGGFFGMLMLIGLIIRIIHEILFERALTNMLKEDAAESTQPHSINDAGLKTNLVGDDSLANEQEDEEPKDIREVFSYNTFMEMSQKLGELHEKDDEIYDLKKEVRSQNLEIDLLKKQVQNIMEGMKFSLQQKQDDLNAKKFQ